MTDTMAPITGTPSAPKIDLGPRGLVPAEGSPFLLSKREFLLVQTYVDAGTRLPSTREEMQEKLGISADDAAEFDDLVGAYARVAAHCRTFSKETFPATVSLASDISSYGLSVANVYGAVMKVIEDWQAGTLAPERAQARLEALLELRRTEATDYRDRATAVKARMNDFIDQTKGDRDALAPIQKRYHERYEGEKGEIAQFRTRIDQLAGEIERLTKEYEHDVIVAATTPTYAWVFPFGTIAAAVVAGVYGKRATDALAALRKDEKDLKAENAGLWKALTLMNDLALANASVDGIVEKLNAALPVLEQIEGIWGALADDLGNVLYILKTEVEDVPAIIKDLGVTDAIEAWRKIVAIADQYRANAYITVLTEEQAAAQPAAQLDPARQLRAA